MGNPGSENLRDPRGIAAAAPGAMLSIVCFEMAALFVVLLMSLYHWPTWWPTAGYVIGGVLPVIVPWAGALGGTTHALYSLIYNWYRYRGGTLDRDRGRVAQGWTWNVFYPTRILLGTVFGTVAVLIVVVVTKSIDVGMDSQKISAEGKAVLFVIAFAVGFQQSNFKALLEKVTALILAPSDSDTDKTRESSAETSTVRFVGSTLFGEVQVGSPSPPRPIFVENTTAKAIPDAEFKVTGTDTTAFLLTTSEALPLPAQSAAPVTVLFAPSREGTREATLALIRQGKTIDSVQLFGRGTLSAPPV